MDEGRSRGARIGGLTAVLLVGGWLWWRDGVPTPPPAPPPVPNEGFTLLQSARKKIVAVVEVGEALEDPARSRPSVRRLVAMNGAALSEARRALGLPLAVPRSAEGDFPPTLLPQRELGRLFALEARARAAAGDTDGALASVFDCLALGNPTNRSGNGGVERAVGLLAQDYGRAEAWPLLDRLTPAQARAAVSRMEALRSDRATLALSLAQEQVYGRRAAAWLLADPKRVVRTRAEMNLPSETPMRDWWRVRSVCLRVGRRRMYAETAAYLDRSAAAATLSYARRPPLPPPAFWEVLLPGSFDVSQRLSILDARAEAQDALLTTAFALRVYKAEHGRCPDKLESLVAGGYLTAPCPDPFSADGRTALHYRRHGSGYRLYSVGPDGRDDGGRAIENRRDEDGQLVHPGEPGRRATHAHSTGDVVAGVNVR